MPMLARLYRGPFAQKPSCVIMPTIDLHSKSSVKNSCNESVRLNITDGSYGAAIESIVSRYLIVPCALSDLITHVLISPCDKTRNQ